MVRSAVWPNGSVGPSTRPRPVPTGGEHCLAVRSSRLGIDRVARPSQGGAEPNTLWRFDSRGALQLSCKMQAPPATHRHRGRISMNVSLYWTTRRIRRSWQHFRFRAQCWWLNQEMELLHWRLRLGTVRHPLNGLVDIRDLSRSGGLCCPPAVREYPCGTHMNRRRARFSLFR